MTVIEVFADVSCPFTQVGLHRWFERRDDADRPDVQLRVRAWPLELVNGTPLVGESLAPKVAALSKPFPDLFVGFDPDSFPSSTLGALQLTNAAYRIGLATGEQVATSLRDRLFVRGEDISDWSVLADVAGEHGMTFPSEDDARAVLADLEEGRRRGVIGSPHYFGPGFDAFCPGLDIAHDDAGLDVSAASDKFDAFVDRCLS